MTRSKNNTNNDTRSFMEVLLYSGQIATMFMCVVLMGLGVGMAMAQETAVKIGNPTLARWPASGNPAAPNGDPAARRRSAWDMHYFNGRIYIDSGDHVANSGPTDIWTYNGTGLVKEYTVDDEMVFDFFEYDNKLFIPGNDATEDWSFGNLYINDPNLVPNPGWIKLRTLPGCLHSWCVAMFQNKLYANMRTDGSTPNRILVSTDMGQSWTTFISEYGFFVVVTDFMFIDADGAWPAYGGNYYKYDGTIVQKVTPNLYPDWTGGKDMNVARTVRYQDGVLYAPVPRESLVCTPLFFLPASEIKNSGTATKIAQFATDNVRDILVRDTACYVMTSEEITQDVAYKGRIYSSDDLTHWSLATEFTVPGIPLSFEIMNNKFYVGLGGRYERSLRPFLIGPESGSIWEIVPASSPVDQLVDLDTAIEEMVLSGEIAPELAGSLVSKVDAALSALARGNRNDAKVAMNCLKALINEVEAQTDKKIDAAAAAELIERVDSIIAALEELTGQSLSTGHRALITSVAAVPTAIGAEIVFTSSADAHVTVTVLNIAGRTVRHLVTGYPAVTGLNTFTWTRLSDQGVKVPGGMYLVRVTSGTPEGAMNSAIGLLRLNH